jgi:hypothetical protein
VHALPQLGRQRRDDGGRRRDVGVVTHEHHVVPGGEPGTGDLGEARGAPAATRVGGAGVDRDESSPDPEALPDPGPRRLGDVQPGVEGDRFGAGERGHLERPDDLVLVVDVADPALQDLGVLGGGAHGVTGTEPEQERVRVPAAAVQLHREVEAPVQPVEEVLLGRCALAGVPDAGHDGELLVGVHGLGAALEHRPRRRRPEQRDPGSGVRGGQGLDRREGEHQVAQSPAAEHRDLADTVEPFSAHTDQLHSSTSTGRTRPDAQQRPRMDEKRDAVTAHSGARAPCEAPPASGRTP